MAVLDTCKFEDDLKALSCGQHFLHYKCMGKFFIAQGGVTPKWILHDLAKNWTRPRFYSCPRQLQVCKDSIKNEVAILRTTFSRRKKKQKKHFPHYKSMGPIGCHRNRSFDPICAKALWSLSPTPAMLPIQSDQDWPIGLRDIQVWKCEQSADHWHTISSPCEPAAQLR